ncbi:MAG: fasciclin domain-containing protein [Chitinophagaceae bacterium]|nr:fasciclin domain-containing protein [Chitinophagaceae bacterium]MBK8951846.1 fasciclin domain-containing protein [Chitinophagaceae bacterium]
MKSRFRHIVFIAVAIGLSLSGCQKMTDEHNEITDGALKKDLMRMIIDNPDLFKFAEILKETGYDKELSSSKSYTVFALKNNEVVSMDPVIRNDPARLKAFVGNHIARQLYSTKQVTVPTRIQMLNGKYNNMNGSQIGEALITDADNYASNGLIQIIDRGIPALENCWDFVTGNIAAPANQKTFMLSLFKNVFDPTNGVVIGIHPTTGAPIYQPGTDSVYTNLFWNKVHDLKREDKQFTLFMLTDAAWDAEQVKYTPYFVTNTVDSNKLVTGWNVLKDFAVDTVYDPATIPDTVLSKFGTKIPIDRSAIVKTVKTSNGIVYIMSKLDVQPLHKFKPYQIEAENYSSTSHDRRGNTYFRDRFNPITGKDFRDLLVFGHGVAMFNVRYQIEEMPSIKYKAYWVALNDVQTTTHTQKLTIGSTASTTFAYTTVPLATYSEVYLGEFTMTQYQPIYNVYLVAANSTTSSANLITCDYIKLVPSL